ncbi:MAG: LCP family protein [Actinomycetes bacterium]
MNQELPPELSPRQVPGSASGERRRFGGVLGVLATVAASVIFLTSIGGWAVATYYDGQIGRIPGLGGILSGGSSDGSMTVLVAGSDSRVGLNKSEKLALHTGSASGQRSDTMMLVHLSANRDAVTVVSLPRDSWVRIPAWTDSSGKKHPASMNKLNAAYAFGGAPLLIRTVQEATGVSIDHYVEVGFSGVIRMVDAIGGVNVCLPYAANDRRSGLVLPAGRSHVDGQMGLAFVRARYIDPTADLGRMQRQQQFLGAMFNQATSAGVLLNPLKLDRFLKAMLSSVTTDDGMNRDLLMGLASDLQGLKPKDIRFLTVPISNANYSTYAGSAVRWDKAEADRIFGAIEADQPIVKQKQAARPTVAPSSVKVQVLNGSTVAGLAGQASNDLAAAGFVIAAPPSNADATDTTTTVIRYDPQWDVSLKTLQAAFPDADIQPVDGQGGTFVVVVGSAYAAPHQVKVAPARTQKVATTTAADKVCG